VIVSIVLQAIHHMKLNEIASVSGKGGLYKIVGSTKGSLILESLDTSKTKLVAGGNQKISVLTEISIYTNNKEGTTPLEDVLKKIHAEFGDDPGVDSESDPNELKAFLKSVLPDYDEQRVYVSDIRKLVKWYATLVRETPDLFTEKGKPEEEKTKPSEG
jgi:hypothetical protein